MNQTSKTNNARISNERLYIFDCDGLLYQHQNSCYERMRDIGAKVIQAYTDLPYDTAYQLGCDSWEQHCDGFLLLKEKFGTAAYLAMHRHFDMVARLDVSGIRDEHLPNMIWDLSKQANVCFLSHTNTRSLKMMMTRMGYNPVLVDSAAYGIDAFHARKDESCTSVFNKVCHMYGVEPKNAVMIEDSKTNLMHAKQSGIGRTVLVDWGRAASLPDGVDESYRSTTAFVQRELHTHMSRQLVA